MSAADATARCGRAEASRKPAAAADDAAHMSQRLAARCLRCERYPRLTRVWVKNSSTNAAFIASQCVRKRGERIRPVAERDDDLAQTATETLRPCCSACLSATYCHFFARYIRLVTPRWSRPGRV